MARSVINSLERKVGELENSNTILKHEISRGKGFEAEQL